jgi:hypothetical protein
MLDSKRFVVLFCMLCAVPAFAKAPQWKSFTPKDGSFTAVIPANPVQKQQGPKLFLWSSGSKKSVYWLGYAPVAGLSKKTPAERKLTLKKMADQFVKSVGIKEISRKQITKANASGVEINGTLVQMPLEVRLFAMVKSERIYFEVAIGTTDRTRFFSGFKIK